MFNGGLEMFVPLMLFDNPHVFLQQSIKGELSVESNIRTVIHVLGKCRRRCLTQLFDFNDIILGFLAESNSNVDNIVSPVRFPKMYELDC